MNRDRARLRTTYQTAVATLSPLTRTVFLMHRAEELPYHQISVRLSIEVAVVESCLAHALIVIADFLDGRPIVQGVPSLVADAEAVMLQRYRACCVAAFGRCDTRPGQAIRCHRSFDQWLWDKAK